uniref:Uncharacterized protein n=1 Tax=Oryza glumipatula TaxID=40148 RepID=A0A0E0B468_9ORYZ
MRRGSGKRSRKGKRGNGKNRRNMMRGRGSALESKLNIDFLPPCPPTLQTSSGSAASNENVSPAIRPLHEHSVDQVGVAVGTAIGRGI